MWCLVKADRAELPLYDEVSDRGLFGVFGSPSSKVVRQSGVVKKE